MAEPDDKAFFIRIQNGDKKAFKVLFESYYPSLCVYAYRLVNENETAEEMVQQLFVKIWEKRSSLKIESSVKQYLFRSLHNQCLNYIQHQKIKLQYAQRMIEELKREPDPAEYFLEPGLAQKIEESINSLPKKRREIFRMSREEGMKYKEIARKLNISVKTVEAQMGLALKNLREKLKDFK